VPELRAELLQRLERRRDRMVAAIVARIFEDVAEYRALSGTAPREQAEATVGETLDVVLRMLAENRSLGQAERLSLRQAGGVRAEQGLLLESLHAAIRIATETAWNEVLTEAALLPLSAEGQMSLGRLAFDVFTAADDVTVALDAGYLERRSQRLQRRERQQSEVVGELLRGDFSDEAQMAARAAEVGLDLSGPVALLLIAVPGHADEDLIPRSAAAAIARRLPRAVDGGAQTDPAHVRILLPGIAEPDWPGTLHSLEHLAAEDRVLILTHPPVVGPVALKQAYRRAAERLPLARGIFLRRPVVPVSELDVYALLQATPAADRREFMREVLGPVLDLPSNQAISLMQTLGAIFDTGGRLATAAAILNLHVNTVKQRVRRLESLTGHRMDVAGERLRLELALHLTRMIR
jgi:hypothetical protein